MNRTFLSSTQRTLTLAAVLVATPVFAWAQNAPSSAAAVQQPTNATERAISPLQTQALFNAMRAGNREAARAAILAGADVNVAGSDGMTALMRAAQFRQPEIVQILLDHGARADARDKAGRTALHFAVPESATPESATEAVKPKKKKQWGKMLGGLASVASGGLLDGASGMMVGGVDGQSVLSGLDPADLAVIEKIKAAATTGDQAAVEAMMKMPDVAALMQKIGGARAAAAEADEATRTIITALMQKGAPATTANLQSKTPAMLARERGLDAIAALLTTPKTTPPAASTPTSEDKDAATKGEKNVSPAPPALRADY